MLPLGLLLIAAPALPTADPAPRPTPEQIEFFEKKVRPLLAEHCYACHGPKKQNAGLRLDTAAGLKAGADNGPVVVPGDVNSRLLKAVRREGDYPMPPKGPLPPEAVAVLTEWVKSGAVYPTEAEAVAGTDPRRHWAFQPVREPPVPAVASGAIVRNPIDAFVLKKLEGSGLTPAPTADRRTLVRRAYFDLHGLPPTAEEVEAFVRDPDPEAWDKLIDRLLASPRYGERWGRYWLDLARYADSKGYAFRDERMFPYSYTYRDYVIRSFNEDKPYDRFIVEQLAADLLDLGEDKRPLAALGFLTLGRRFLENIHDIIDDRIDVVTRGLMGLTVGCARCHDHKYDPIPIADYYSLYGVFAGTHEPKELPLIGEAPRTPEVLAFEAELARREAAYQAEVSRRHQAAVRKLQEPTAVARYLQAALESRSLPPGRLAGFAEQRDLNAYVLGRWRAFLANELQAWSPVYSPLAELAALPADGFAQQARERLVAWAMDPTRPVNPSVAEALRRAEPKTWAEAVAAVAAVIARPPAGAEPNPAEVEARKALTAGGPLDIPLSDFEKIRDRADRDALADRRKQIEAFKATHPAAPPRAHVLYDNAQPYQPVVFLRGNPNNRGPAVPRQMPAVVAPDRRPFTRGSGRLELAHAIASPDNPLTARVFVNRVWLGHFGQGIVRTPSDFGTRCDPPTHPELLDWLAVQFVRSGWSVKKLHKLIMTSEAYRRSSVVSDLAYRLDPENRLLARQNRRRLDFEALRDSLLAAAGRLDLTMGGKPVDLFQQPFSTRRTIYGLIDRTHFPGTFRVFDVANPDTHSPQRYQTTVPQQALFLMNSPFVQEQAKALAGRSEVAEARSAADKVRVLYRLALARDPTPAEVELAVAFVAEDDPASGFGRWPQLAQVLLMSNEFTFVD